MRLKHIKYYLPLLLMPLFTSAYASISFDNATLQTDSVAAVVTSSDHVVVTEQTDTPEVKADTTNHVSSFVNSCVIISKSDNTELIDTQHTSVEYSAPPKYSAQDDPNRDWLHLLKKGYFNPQDTTVKYSKFMELFCKVYNWGDRTFNSYDTDYVVGFGRNWKARVAFDIWNETHYINFGHKMPMLFATDPYTSAAVYLHFMAVSVNYQFDIGKIFFGKPIRHNKIELGFNCARFNAELTFTSNTGGTYVRTFGDYNKVENHNHISRIFFPGTKSTIFNASIFYFFNNRKYANGAAYTFSKLQKKSAGSFIAGFNYNSQNMTLNFGLLPEQLLPYYVWNLTRLKFHYSEYCLLGGYGYNWVTNKHLLYNITILPSIGITNCAEDNHDSGSNTLALNGQLRMSLTYNLNDFFICMIAKGAVQWYHNNNVSLFSGVQNASLSIGYRF